MRPEVLEYLSFSLIKEEQLLHSRWLRNVSSTEYREGITAMKELVMHHGVELWLTDSRLLDTVLFADQQWVKRELGPFLKLSNLQKIARVLTDDVFNYISFENMIQQVKEEYEATVELAQFSSLEAAFDWLRME